MVLVGADAAARGPAVVAVVVAAVLRVVLVVRGGAALQAWRLWGRTMGVGEPCVCGGRPAVGGVHGRGPPDAPIRGRSHENWLSAASITLVYNVLSWHSPKVYQVLGHAMGGCTPPTSASPRHALTDCSLGKFFASLSMVTHRAPWPRVRADIPPGVTSWEEGGLVLSPYIQGVRVGVSEVCRPCAPQGDCPRTTSRRILQVSSTHSHLHGVSSIHPPTSSPPLLGRPQGPFSWATVEGTQQESDVPGVNPVPGPNDVGRPASAGRAGQSVQPGARVA